jgi:bis(5'-nucleosyl)-tetraphosphatase (symmetrical)
MSGASTTAIVIGDVHGCIEELDALLTLLSVKIGAPAREQLVFVGDLMDRGPDPVGVVRRVRELGARAVMGNHDEKHVRYAKHEARRKREPGYRNPVSLNDERTRQHLSLSEEDHAFLASRPTHLALDDEWVVVHGGFEPNRAIDQQKSGVMLRLRHVDALGRMVSLGQEGPTTSPWATRWQGPESVVYGHDVHDLEHPRVDHPREGVSCYGIDTGCCFGGRLTALVLPTREFVQVVARRPYAAMHVEP